MPFLDNACLSRLANCRHMPKHFTFFEMFAADLAASATPDPRLAMRQTLRFPRRTDLSTLPHFHGGNGS